MAGAAGAALVTLLLTRDAGVVGPAAVPALLRTGVVTVVLFAICGYGPARALLPRRWLAHLPLFALGLGAACSSLELTVLGLLHVPLDVSLAIVLGAGVLGGVVAHRRGDSGPAAGAKPRLVNLAVPLFLASLVCAVMVLPSLRAGFATVQGQNGDAILFVGTAELLEHAPPTADRPDLPLDRVPLVWRSKLPAYYVLAGVSRLAGQDPIVAFSGVSAIMTALAALGLALFAIYALGAGIGAALCVLFLVGLDRIVVHVTIHPFYNQAWAFFALPFALLFGWRFLREPDRRSAALAAIFGALALLMYPLLLPFPAVFLGVVAWDTWRERRSPGWWSALGLPAPRAGAWRYALIVLLAVVVAPVLARGVVEKILPAIDAVRPGGDLRGWSDPRLPYFPFGRFFGIESAPVVVAPAVTALFAAAWLGVRRAPREVARALVAMTAGALVTAVYLLARDHAELFYFRDLAFAGPFVLTAGIVGLASATGRAWRLAGVAALAALVVALGAGTRREVAGTYELATHTVLELRRWDRDLPRDETIRIDVPAGSWQLFSWYLMPGHRLSALAPLGGFYPHPPQSRKADLVLVQRPQKRPPDAIGRPIRANAEYAIYRLDPRIPGRDVSSRALVYDVTKITF